MEFEWTVGPIPFGDGRGREVSLRFQSSLDSGALHHDAPQAMYTYAQCILQSGPHGRAPRSYDTLLCLFQILHVTLGGSRRPLAHVRHIPFAGSFKLQPAAPAAC